MNKIPRRVVIYHISSSCNYVNFCKAQYINYILVKMIVVANLPREYLTVSIEYHEEESMVSPALSVERQHNRLHRWEDTGNRNDNNPRIPWYIPVHIVPDTRGYIV